LVGVAWVFGHSLRCTKDIDIVLASRPDNVNAGFAALAEVGYRPTVPVSASEFGDAATRRRWIEDKGMQVLNFFNDRFPATSVDVLVHESFDFDSEYQNALVGAIASDLEARFVSSPTLIGMKQKGDRTIDRMDIEYLRWMLEDDRDE